MASVSASARTTSSALALWSLHAPRRSSAARPASCSAPCWSGRRVKPAALRWRQAVGGELAPEERDGGSVQLVPPECVDQLVVRRRYHGPWARPLVVALRLLILLRRQRSYASWGPWYRRWVRRILVASHRLGASLGVRLGFLGAIVGGGLVVGWKRRVLCVRGHFWVASSAHSPGSMSIPSDADKCAIASASTCQTA